MPQSFTALDAILVTSDKVIGIQIKTLIEEGSLKTKIESVRRNLQLWKNKSCNLLGSDGLVMYMVGVDEVSPGLMLQLASNEKLVTAGNLREHFLDVFFRYGLTGGESNYS